MNHIIRRTLIAAGIALVMGPTISGIASSDETVQLQPLQAHTIDLDDRTAVIYYVVNHDGSFEIVTTVGPDVETDGIISQSHTTILPGQSFSWSLDTGVPGTAVNALEISAAFDKLIVAQH
ncbi:MAG: hypothetical protein KTR32_37480 [Granulosicoccus sp.]|nr:hypothetical protein [Granulosicoccus sp.]